MSILTITFKSGVYEQGFADTWEDGIINMEPVPLNSFTVEWATQSVLMDGEQNQVYYGLRFDGYDVEFKYQGSWVTAYSYYQGWQSSGSTYNRGTVFYNTSTGPKNLTQYFHLLEQAGLATIGGTMPNTYNKVIINGTTYIDLSTDDVSAGQVLDTVTAFHDNNGATLSGTIPSLSATTYNTSSSNQTISAGQYLSGAQTIRGVTTSGISAANIKSGVVVKVGDSADDDRITSATGTFTSDATITTTGNSGSKTSSELLSGKTAYAVGEKVTGSMANRGSNNVTVSTVAGTTIPAGYYNGGGKAVIDSASASELASGAYILTGHTILGVAGTLNPSSAVTHAALSAASTFSAQTIAPADKNVQFFDTVTIAPISVAETLTGETTGYTVTVSDGTAS